MRKHATALAVALCLAWVMSPSIGHSSPPPILVADCDGYGDPTDIATVVFGGCSTSFTASAGTLLTFTLIGRSPLASRPLPFSGVMNLSLTPQACQGGDRYCMRRVVFAAGAVISGSPTLGVTLPTSGFWTVYLDTTGVGGFQLKVTKPG